VKRRESDNEDHEYRKHSESDNEDHEYGKQSGSTRSTSSTSAHAWDKMHHGTRIRPLRKATHAPHLCLISDPLAQPSTDGAHPAEVKARYQAALHAKLDDLNIIRSIRVSTSAR
jgi:hypothetical protein